MLNPRGWLGIAATIVMAAALSACGGSDGDAGPQGDKGDPGEQGEQGPPGPAGSGAVNLAALSPEQWAAAEFKAAVTSVTVASPPVVEFTVTDKVGNPVTGLESFTTTSSSTGVTTYPNLSFALAKLEPHTDAKPSTWVSYMVTANDFLATDGTLCKNYASRPNVDNNGTLEVVKDASGNAIPGRYTYKFARDITTIATTAVDRPTSTSDKCYEVSRGSAAYPSPTRAQLGDLSYQQALPHRLVIQLSGAARGTGTNTPNAAQSTPAVNLENPLNVVYDFKPGATGQPGTPIPPSELTREDVNIDTCNVCHGKLAFHGGSARVDVKYCVVCHTTQRGYGYANTASVNAKFNEATFKETKSVNAATGITSYSYSPGTNIADNEVAGNFTTMIHKIHQGHTLVKENYNYANLVFDDKGFSKLGGGQRMCTTCHDSKVAQTANNHKQLPSRQACGACHDGINFATGGGSTLADKEATLYSGLAPATSGHGVGAVGGPQADDGSCSTCHTPDGIRISHRMENLTKNNTYILPGLATFEYKIDSATQATPAGDVVIKFRILQRIANANGNVDDQPIGTPVTFKAPYAQPNPAVILDGFTGSPSFLLAYAKEQDGIKSPSDFNNLGIKQGQPISVAISALLNTSTSTTGANINTVGSLAGPETDGTYTATIRGNGSNVCGSADSGRVKCVFPDGAKMRTVALQGYFTQVNAPKLDPSDPDTVGRHAISVLKTVNGDTPRRTIVDAGKCAGCHEWFEGHGGNRVYETQVCVMCHNTGLATSGRGIADTTLAAYNTNPATGAEPATFSVADNKILKEWGIKDASGTLVKNAMSFPVTSNNFKDMIHGIHAGRERVTPFQDARDRTSVSSTTGAVTGAITLLDFRRMDFPGKLNNCETCHVTYTGTGSGATQTYAVIPSGALVSTYESINADYWAVVGTASATPALAKASLNQPNLTDTVTTPFAGACVSCHDNQAAKAHMTLNGGSINVTRSAAQPTPRPLEDVESCAVCHGPGRDFDTAKVHK